jgi:transposase
MCHDRVVQPDEEPSTMTLTTIGLDVAKLVFQVHGVDENSRAALKRKLHRHEVVTFFEERGATPLHRIPRGVRCQPLLGSPAHRLGP